ncbi:MAG: hypothetical protein ACK559_13780, partial [bacterium]
VECRDDDPPVSSVDPSAGASCPAARVEYARPSGPTDITVYARSNRSPTIVQNARPADAFTLSIDCP